MTKQTTFIAVEYVINFLSARLGKTKQNKTEKQKLTN